MPEVDSMSVEYPKEMPHRMYDLEVGDHCSQVRIADDRGFAGEFGKPLNFQTPERFQCDSTDLVGTYFLCDPFILMHERFVVLIRTFEDDSAQWIDAEVHTSDARVCHEFKVLIAGEKNRNFCSRSDQCGLKVSENFIQAMQQEAGGVWGVSYALEDFWDWFARERLPDFSNACTALQSYFKRRSRSHLGIDFNGRSKNHFILLAEAVAAFESSMIDWGGMLPVMRKFKQQLQGFKCGNSDVREDEIIAAPSVSNFWLAQEISSKAFDMLNYCEAMMDLRC
jgi:hypothetical protein